MGGKDKKKPAGKKKELTEEEMRRMGMPEEQIAEIIRMRGQSTEEKKKESEEQEQLRRERDAKLKEEKRQREEAERAEMELKKALAVLLIEEEVRRNALVDEEADEFPKVTKTEKYERSKQEAIDRKRRYEEESRRRHAEWEALPAEEREARKKAYDEQYRAQEAKAEEERLANERRQDEEQRKRQAEREALEKSRERAARLRAEREELIAKGLFVGDEDAGLGSLDAAFERDEKVTAQGEQAKAAREAEKMAAKLAERQALKAFQNRPM